MTQKRTLVTADADKQHGMPAAVTPELDVWHYLSVARRWWWLIVISGVVALLAGWWSQRDAVPMYEAETLLQSKPSESAAVVPWAMTGGSDFGTALDIIRSNEVMGPVTDSLGLQIGLRDQRSQRTAIIRLATTAHNAPHGTYFMAFKNGQLELRLQKDGAPISSAKPGEPLTGPGFEILVGDPLMLL